MDIINAAIWIFATIVMIDIILGVYRHVDKFMRESAKITQAERGD